jgi:hypothetical protein
MKLMHILELDVGTFATAVQFVTGFQMLFLANNIGKIYMLSFDLKQNKIVRFSVIGVVETIEKKDLIIIDDNLSEISETRSYFTGLSGLKKADADQLSQSPSKYRRSKTSLVFIERTEERGQKNRNPTGHRLAHGYHNRLSLRRRNQHYEVLPNLRQHEQRIRPNL